MTQDKALDLMKSSKSEKEWNNNQDAVKEAHANQFPDWWYDKVIASGLYYTIKQTWQ